MTKAELIQALQVIVRTRGLSCLSCGHEHNCSTRGCAIIRAAVEELKKTQWVSAADRPPEEVKEQAEMKVVQEMEQRHPRLKLRIGSSVYFVLLDDTGWRISVEEVVEVGENGFFIGETEPNEYILYTYLRECYFFTRREAEEAKEAKEQEKICCNCKYYDLLPFCGQCNCPQSEFYLQHIPVDICCECFKGCEENKES